MINHAPASGAARITLLAGTALLLPLASTPARAQQAAPPPAAATSEAAPDDAGIEEDGDEIVVVGQRIAGSVIGDIPPENTLTARDVRSTGATSINELLEALGPQLGSARGRGGERPIVLLNGQRISGFREIRDIPPEAIRRVEILPEEVALKYGYRADQRVVNIILRQRFRSTVARLEGSTPTEGGFSAGEADLTRLMIQGNGRTLLDLDVETSSALTEAERDIALEDGEDVGPDPRGARTLIGSSRQVTATATHSRPLLGTAATINGEYRHSEGRSLLGFPTLADGTPILSETDPRARDTRSDSGHAGVSLNWDRSRWRYSVTGNADLVRSVTDTDPGEFEADFGNDRSRTVRTSGDVDAIATGPMFRMPAGTATVTLKAGASTLDLDSRRRNDGETTSRSLGRTQGNTGFNFDLPVSRRNSDFGGAGNLTLNANGEVQELSDFGTLTTIGAGANWSPAEPLDFILSWTREEGAPSIAQLGDPLLETPDFRIFDFTRGESVLVEAITGGNPDLEADRRNVFKIGGNLRPLKETDLRLRAEYVRSKLDNPVSSFPGPSEALEAAFPGRFERDADGRLVRVDLRPVNFDEARRQTFRWGFDFTKPLKSRRPTAGQIQRLRSSFGRPPQVERPNPTSGREAGARGERQSGFGGGARGFGGGRFGGRRGGRLTFSLTHTVNLVDEVTIGEGVPVIDYLSGEALGSSGGRSRHQVEAQAGWFNNGLGARLSGNWRSATRIENPTSGDLRFSPFARLDLRLFANLGERFDLVSREPWLRGTSVRFEVQNLLNAKPRVRDRFGDVPFNYQPDLLDPQGRVVSFSVRKLFSPRPFRRQRRQRD